MLPAYQWPSVPVASAAMCRRHRDIAHEHMHMPCKHTQAAACLCLRSRLASGCWLGRCVRRSRELNAAAEADRLAQHGQQGSLQLYHGLVSQRPPLAGKHGRAVGRLAVVVQAGRSKRWVLLQPLKLCICHMGGLLLICIIFAEVAHGRSAIAVVLIQAGPADAQILDAGVPRLQTDMAAWQGHMHVARGATIHGS